MSYEIDINDLFPTKGMLNNVGFLFGAGSSKEAGYPLIFDLTKNVLKKLDSEKRDLIRNVLKRDGFILDEINGKPDIESISDVISKAILDGDSNLQCIQSELHAHIVREMESVQNPKIEHHITFFERLKKRCGGNPTTIWIFTTNYDILFELAAFHTGINLNTGFTGTLKRFFKLDTFELVYGMVKNRKFNKHKELTVNLIKLHGSICWRNNTVTNVFEESLDVVESDPMSRLMILPRRKKVFETLNQPYSSLFRFSSSILGSRCKYLVSCGFSYNDEHIMESLINPAVQNNSFRLVALLGENCKQIEDLKARHPQKVFFCTPDMIALEPYGSSDADVVGWKFSELARIF